jgi:hypothetical protein
MDAKAIRYVREHMNLVRGWLDAEDAMAIIALDAAQKRLEVIGSIAEVGVYCGRTLALLSLLTRWGENAIGIDSFDIGRASESETRAAISLYGHEANTILRVHDSRATSVLPDCRIIHIDGSHEYEACRADLTDYSRWIGDGGVMVIDDYFTRDHLGVAAATLDFLNAPDHGFVPFFASPNKLFLCAATMARRYQKEILLQLDTTILWRVQSIKRHPVLIYRAAIPMEMFEITYRLEEHA